jgi:phosphate-selective porin OprO/OprP
VNRLALTATVCLWLSLPLPLHAQEVAQQKAEAARQAKVRGDAVLKSSDGRVSVELHGLIQTDGRKFLGDDAHTFVDNVVLRRVRPILSGKPLESLSFLIVPDFGEGKAVLQDAWFEWTGDEALKVRVGKFKAPFGLERLQSDAHRMFVETGYATQLAPNRELGVQISGCLADKRLGYAVAAVDGVVDGTVAEGDANDSKDLLGRLWIQPFADGENPWLQSLLFGAAYSWGDQDGTAANQSLPGFKSPGQNSIYAARKDEKGKDAAGKDITLANPYARGIRTRWAVHGHWYAGPFAVLGEYVQVSEGTRKDSVSMDFKASSFSGQASCTLGGTASFEGVTPTQAFAVGQPGWGAVEFAARWSKLDLDHSHYAVIANDSKSVRTASSLTGGIHWHWSPRVRWFADFEHTVFTAGDVGPSDRKSEDVIVARAQFTF